MYQKISKRNYLWVLLGMLYNNTVFGVKEEQSEIYAESSIPGTPMVQDVVVEERELESSMNSLNKEPQRDVLFIESDHLMEHLVSSGGTPFSQSEMLGMTVSASNLDIKSKEALVQQKDWLAKLIEEYLQHFRE
ncbi:MAG: hypothetical protein J0H12_05625 [Candidatus Paracaedimonas acanthamoebae]|uniref:Uncharacterized protein n=1 Tax=Candidatus Paracaedimonas acanthamoebae TaxID=244581 RepID=A0A8J7PYJ8_9PROT|nr:hypothetical protein [Candidatus Paracaedimonas acanthamoebae]